MGRYYEAEPEVYNLMDELIDERFGNTLRAATIKILMDSKTKVDKLTNRMTFASIKSANEVEKFLSKDGHNIEGIDYIIFLSDLVWENLQPPYHKEQLGENHILQSVHPESQSATHELVTLASRRYDCQ